MRYMSENFLKKAFLHFPLSHKEEQKRIFTFPKTIKAIKP